MSRYETLRDEVWAKNQWHALAACTPAAAIGIGGAATLGSQFGASAGIVVGLILFLFSIPLSHCVLQFVSSNYRTSVNNLHGMREEIEALRSRVQSIYSRYRRRSKGQQFKDAYSLCGRDISGLEEALAVGMSHEVKEVYVTAFMKKGIAVRVTASIGSARRCAPSDDISQWRRHVMRLGCDEVRQYHNHPVTSGKTEPSSVDHESTQTLRMVLREHDHKLRSFIVYWNEIGEWKIIEYNDRGYCMHFEFDASC